jgi:2-dehydropantoate 2-reductase
MNKIAIIGAGGIGGYYGLKLASAGFPTVLMARGAHLLAIQKNGIAVLEKGTMHTVNTDTVDGDNIEEYAKLSDADWVIFTVKSQDTAITARKIKPYIKNAHILSLQNGVDNELVLQEIFETSVVGGYCIKMGTHRIAPGVVEATGDGIVVFGEYPRGVSARTEALVDIFNKAEVAFRVSEDIRRELWQKLVLNNGCNPLSALIDKDTGFLTHNVHTQPLVKAMMKEAAEAAQADHVDISNKEVEEMFTLIYSLVPLPTSMQMDRKANRPLELNAISGAVCQRMRQLGKRAPTTEIIDALLRALSA